MKVMMVSTFFPKTHRFNGLRTTFEVKIWSTLVNLLGFSQPKFHKDITHESTKILEVNEKTPLKLHTIRAGSSWKEGQELSLRCWSGKPYNSKQEVIANGVKIQKVQSIKYVPNEFLRIGDTVFTGEKMQLKLFRIAKNDGFSTLNEFLEWFQKPFVGNIIWFVNPDDLNINYEK